MAGHLPARGFRTTRLACALLIALAATGLGAAPALAGSGSSEEQAAQQALNQAKVQQQAAAAAAAAATQQLDAARTQLAQAQAQLAALQARVTQLDAQIASDQAEVRRLDAEAQQDRAQLGALLRTSYESVGTQGAVASLVDARSIDQMVGRLTALDHLAHSVQQLVARIAAEQRGAASALAASVAARQRAEAAQAQARTQDVVIAAEEATDAELAARADYTAQEAQLAVNGAQRQLTAIQQYEAAYGNAAQALATARADGTIFLPIPGPVFTEDTDLTLPSGENAQTLDSFLAGSALAGLGSSYLTAERTYGVSALYLVAHSIEESAWGTSALAQQKHNLFGFNANDSNPYGDASSFPSFAACILYVAHYVKVNDLTPGGAFYHGPTLRGMNVDYASDPLWASKIAAIADTIPLP
jgi:beta-N-acetylglucosaminidase